MKNYKVGTTRDKNKTKSIWVSFPSVFGVINSHSILEYSTGSANLGTRWGKDTIFMRKIRAYWKALEPIAPIKIIATEAEAEFLQANFSSTR